MWSIEQGNVSLLNLAASQLMTHVCASNGMDNDGTRCRSTSPELYVQLCKTVDNPFPSVERNDLLSEDEVRFKAHTLWGYFAAATCVVTTQNGQSQL